MSPQLQSELDRIVHVLKSDYQPQQIILYGSAATGNTDSESDLDIVVIKKTTSRFSDRIGEVLRLTRPTQAVDFLVYTPEEFNIMKKNNWFVGEEIAKKGKTLYVV